MIKVFQIVTKDGFKSQLKFAYTLDTNATEREMLSTRKDELFGAFHRAHISHNMMLHIDNWYI
jgi:hypothetical protein